jgi:hypothetical protein
LSFMLLGAVIAFAALLVTTVLDHTVSSSVDLLAISGISLVATVPPVKLGRGDGGKWSMVRSRKRRPRAATSGGV